MNRLALLVAVLSLALAMWTALVTHRTYAAAARAVERSTP